MATYKCDRCKGSGIDRAATDRRNALEPKEYSAIILCSGCHGNGWWFYPDSKDVQPALVLDAIDLEIIHGNWNHNGHSGTLSLQQWDNLRNYARQPPLRGEPSQ